MNEDKLLDQAAALLRGGAPDDEDFEIRRRDWMDRYYLTQNPKVWQVQVNGAAVKVEDLPLRTIDRIAKDSVTSWLLVVNNPLLDAGVALDVYTAAAEHLGATAIPDISTRQIVDVFVLVPDTVPEPDPVLEVDDADPLAPSPGPTNETPG